MAGFENLIRRLGDKFRIGLAGIFFGMDGFPEVHFVRGEGRFLFGGLVRFRVFYY